MARLVIWEEYSVTNTVLEGGQCSPTFSLLEDNGRAKFSTLPHVLSEKIMLSSVFTSSVIPLRFQSLLIRI